MGWKQVFRSIEASSRRAARQAQTRERARRRETHRAHQLAEREAATARKRWEREEKLRRSGDEASAYEAYVEALRTLHSDSSDAWDWETISVTPPPTEPTRKAVAETAARAELEAYQPGFLDRLNGTAKTRRLELEATLGRAIEFDWQQYTIAKNAYIADLAEWNTSVRLAPYVVRLAPQACAEALAHAGAFEELDAFHIKAELSRLVDGVPVLSCSVSHDGVIPEEERHLTASGRVSQKQTSPTHYWELFRDFVSSAAIRAALETFAVLPVGRVIVNMTTRGLDPATGHDVDTTILAVHFTRAGLQALNLERVDPFKGLGNFPHRVKYKKGSILAPVEPITEHDQWVST